MENKRLERAYYNPESPASFGGVQRLARHTGIKPDKVKDWLLYRDAYTLHKPIRKHFPRRKTIVGGIKDQYQCDLIDVQRLRRYNDGYGYILTCIDVFSKIGYAIPIKNKTSTHIIPAFKRIFTDGLPGKLQSDLGTEFLKCANLSKGEGCETFYISQRDNQSGGGRTF